MTTNLHYLIAGMAVLLVVLWQYSHQRQMDDRNSLMFRRLLTVVSLDVLAELVSTCFILYAPYSFGVGRMLSNTVFYLFQAILPLMLLYYVCTLCSSRVISTGTVLRMGIPTIALVIEVEAKTAGVTAFCAKPLFMSELRRILAEPFLPAEAAEQTEKKADFAGKRLLVVEDNALNREIAVTMLEEGGFEVDTAENGKVAVDKVRESAPGYYDLVLMDIQMPIMDGYAAARAIRALPDAEKAGLPIVAMTANAFDEDRQNAEKAGMNGHLSKPFDMQQLLTMLREKLSP